MSFLASIPSPSSGTLELGPLTIHMYGLMLLAGIAVCIWITGRRWVARGGDWDLIFRLAVWGVAAGIIGARLYHLATSWDEVPDEWWGPFAIWRGGLGVWGGIGLGVIVGAFIAYRAGANVSVLLDCVAPGLLAAQAIGRIGNWWNQELYGKPTDLPWRLEIDPEHRPEAYPFDSTFHPTFLYELLWNLLALVILLLVERRWRPRPPSIFALYVSLYCFGRLWIEQLRVDPAHELFGLRINTFVSAAGFVIATAVFIWLQVRERRRRRGEGGQVRERGPAMAVPRGRVR